ncbi:MAG: hypothetical protein HY722_09825 [Planctomycetes bacterium]|nr:hypothetical protein [Planctomycetota bacterium]
MRRAAAILAPVFLVAVLAPVLHDHALQAGCGLPVGDHALGECAELAPAVSVPHLPCLACQVAQAPLATPAAAGTARAPAATEGAAPQGPALAPAALLAAPAGARAPPSRS